MVVYVIITRSNVPSNSLYVLWPQPPRMKATASRPFSSSSGRSSSLYRCCRNDSFVMVVVVCLLKELFRLFSGLQIPSCCLRLLNQLRVILKGNSNDATAAKCHQHPPNNNSMKSLPQPFRILAGTYTISVVLCGAANYS